MRAQAREIAFKILFERLFIKNFSNEFDEEFFASLTKQEDKDFAKSIIENYQTHRQELEEIIKNNLIGYEIERVYKVDLALLNLSLTEILYLQTPYKVAINEALNLAKKFSTEKSSKFINGVLSSIIKQLNL